MNIDDDQSGTACVEDATKADFRMDDERSQVLRLLLEHRNSLLAFIMAATRDMDAAEDIFQEVSLAICESADQFEMGTNFGAWAREIARRRMQAFWRKRQRLPVGMSDETLANLSCAFEVQEEIADAKERRGALQKCLLELKPFVRELFSRRYEERKSLGEIAELVSRRPESVRKALYRGRMALRQCIERRLSEQD